MWIIILIASIIIGKIWHDQEQYVINYANRNNAIIDNQLDEVSDEVTPEESEIIAQEKLVDMYYHVWLYEDEKLRMIPSYKKETDVYYKQWKKTSEAEARYIKAEARLSKLKSKNDIQYVVNI